MFCTFQQADPIHISLDLHTGSIYTGVTVNDFFLKIILFISVCTGSVLLCRLFSSCGEGWGVGMLSTCSVQLSHCHGSSHCGAQAPGMWASVVGARGLHSWGTWAPQLGHVGSAVAAPRL